MNHLASAIDSLFTKVKSGFVAISGSNTATSSMWHCVCSALFTLTLDHHSMHMDEQSNVAAGYYHLQSALSQLCLQQIKAVIMVWTQVGHPSVFAGMSWTVGLNVRR